MRCAKCGSINDKVIDSRETKDGLSVRRRRECIDCVHRFTTYEHLEHGDMRVVKRDGIREPFNRDKLLNGFVKACEKRPVRYREHRAYFETGKVNAFFNREQKNKT